MSRLDDGLHRLARFESGVRGILLGEEGSHAVKAQANDVPVILGRRHRTVDPAAFRELGQRQALVEHGSAEGQLDVPPARLFSEADDGAPDHLPRRNQIESKSRAADRDRACQRKRPSRMRGIVYRDDCGDYIASGRWPVLCYLVENNEASTFQLKKNREGKRNPPI